jgi:negative regulator of flagellin synthesis FlgM
MTADETIAKCHLGEEAMHIYGPSQLQGSQPIGAPHGVGASQPTKQAESPQIADQVDISDAARALDEVHQMPDIRQDRVDAVRQQIADGTYETPDKLDAALERLLDEIG